MKLTVRQLFVGFKSYFDKIEVNDKSALLSDEYRSYGDSPKAQAIYEEAMDKYGNYYVLDFLYWTDNNSITVDVVETLEELEDNE